VGQQPSFTVQKDNNGRITLAARPEKIGSVLGQRTKAAAYTASAAVGRNSLGAGEAAGLAAVGDQSNALGVWLTKDKISLWQVKGDKTQTITEQNLPQEETIQVRMVAEGGDQFRFAWSTNGQTWNELNANRPLDGSYLPPWDRGIRAAMLAKGPAKSDVQFDWFRLKHQQTKQL
jgi:hypothetical protein